MDTQQIPRQRSIEEQIEEYRTIVSDVFAHHRRVCQQSGREICSCGASCPCEAEQLAAQLFDWVD
jgi:hypothetical protein